MIRRALLMIVAVLAAASVAAQPTGVLRAAVSEDTTLTEAEAQAGTGPTSGATQITIPIWESGDRYVFIGVPSDHDAITGINMGWFLVLKAFEAAPEIDGYQWWRTVAAQAEIASGATYGITQG